MKLTNETLIENRNKNIILDLKRPDATLSSVAKKYGVSPRTVGRVRDSYMVGGASNIDLKSTIESYSKKLTQPSATSQSMEMDTAKKLRLCKYIADGTHTVADVFRVWKINQQTIDRIVWEYDSGLLAKPVAVKPVAVKPADVKCNYVITPVNVCFAYQGAQYSADFTNANFNKIILALTSGEYATAVDLTNVSKAIVKYMRGHIKIENGEVMYKGLVIRDGMTNRIIDAMASGDKSRVDSLVIFFGNLLENPSNRAVNELFGFLEANDIELTDDGHFLAWKKVRHNYYDIHSNTMLNEPGTKVSIARNQVDEDSTRTCSYGLHVCSKSYLNHFGSGSGDRVVRCKVNPRDVVAIPADYNNAKMRCSEYLVIDDVTHLF